ncbi:MAG TPA: TolC family protein [Gemmatimonadaceae bacterium]
MNALIRRVAPALVVLPLGGQVLAQAPATPPAMTFEQAVQYALAHHPAVAGAAARIDAARASRDLAAAGRVPSLDAEALLSGATGNVVAGSFLPLVGVPGSSGPVGTTGLGGGAWTTTAALVSTMPLTGLVRANRLTSARTAAERAAESGADATRLDVAYAAAAAYLRTMAAAAVQRATLAGVQRARTLLNSTDALVTQQLRPGADLARARAELADADRDEANAERRRAVAEAELAVALGSPTSVAVVDTAVALAPPIAAPDVEHPLVAEARSTELAAAREHDVAELAWWPRVDIVGALWARGSGILVNGVVAPSMHDGISPSVSNWALGLEVSWPLLGYPAIAAESRRTDAAAAAATASARAVANEVASLRRAAAADAAGASIVVARAKIALDAARVALDQANARYNAGLSSVADVADALHLLARAESAEALARLESIATQLGVARARGNLQDLLALTRAGGAR